MKRIGALNGLGWLVLSLIFQTSYTAAVAAQETDDTAIELNPLDYVPLEVGNRWTYEHSYWSWPRDAEKVLTIEITHTEVIDGLEYFVFSDADYAWPPLPDFFWAGKKVRLSDEGFLVFRWNGQDRSVYDFGRLDNPYEYIGTLPSEFHAARVMGFSVEGTVEVYFTRFYAQFRLSRVIFVFSYRDIIGISHFPLEGGSHFLQGYGLGDVYNYREGFGEPIPPITYRNDLRPISATISGEEIVYEQVHALFYEPHFESTELGQVGQVRMDEGFDFSEGKNSESYNDFDLVLGDPTESMAFAFFSYSYNSPHLYSKTGVANLGRIDFGLLISKGIPPDLRLDSRTALPLYEGHTYAVWSREGGIALLYVFDVEFQPRSHRVLPPAIKRVKSIKFDWIYYPDEVPNTDTSVQPISWGQLKYLAP